MQKKKIKNKIAIFENKEIRRHWNSEKEEWYFSVVDVVEALVQNGRPRKYWNDLKTKLKQEGSQLSEKIGQLKIPASDNKYYLTDVLDTENVLRLIQSIPSPKAEPFKLWLARVGYERLEETADPEIGINRALKTYLQKGYSQNWINQRLKRIVTIIYLAIFLFGLFVPFSQSFAQTEENPITISILAPADLQVNDTITIIARTYNLATFLMSPDTVSFFSYPEEKSSFIGRTTCPTKQDSGRMWSCSVKFKPSKATTYKIDSNFTYSEKNYKATSKNIVVGEKKIAPTCVDPKKLNAAGNACECKDPTQDIKIDCIPSVVSIDGLKISIEINKDKLNLQKGEVVKVTANSNKIISGKIISFSLTGAIFTPLTCPMPTGPSIQTCSVDFIPNVEGSLLPLSASVTIDGKEYKSEAIQVTIKSEIISPPLLLPLNCVAPQRLNDDKTACITDTNTTYTPLAPLPGLSGDEAFETSRQCTKDANGKETCANPCPFGNYLNIIIKIIIGLAAVLAMIMIVYGGIQYMTSDLISSKEAGKEQITHAILGLLLALGAFLILNTINPKLLSACLDKLPQATIVIDDDVPQTAINGMYCTKTAGTNGGYKDGADWATIVKAVVPKLPELKPGIVVNKKECTKVGEQNCTSTFGLNTSYINSIIEKCPQCKPLMVTAGTECWLHGGKLQNTSHHPSSPTVDLRFETKLDAYIKSGVKNGSRYEKDGISYLLEPDHWHAGK